MELRPHARSAGDRCLRSRASLHSLVVSPDVPLLLMEFLLAHQIRPLIKALAATIDTICSAIKL